MSWTLPFLFIQLIAHVRGATGFISPMPELTWTLLLISVVLLCVSVILGYHARALLWLRFQGRSGQAMARLITR